MLAIPRTKCEGEGMSLCETYFTVLYPLQMDFEKKIGPVKSI